MNSPIHSDDERQLSELFGRLNTPLADDGFSTQVLRRIRRRAWWRRVVLAAAATAGGLLAIGPLTEISILLSESLLVVATRWNDPAWLMQNQALIIVVLLSVGWPGLVRLLER